MKRGRIRSSWLVPILLLTALWAVPAASQQREAGAFGTFDYVGAANGILIAAPHGTADVNTAPLAALVAGQLKSGYVLAWGFTPGVRINVNRPTEGAGLACDQERETDRAREAYTQYRRLVVLASGSAPLRLYVEVHGNSRPATREHIEVATKGVSFADASEAKAGYPRILDLIRAEWPTYPRLQLLVEPADRLTLTASCDKRRGMLGDPAITRALHFELPAAARDERLLPASARLVAKIIEGAIGR